MPLNVSCALVSDGVPPRRWIRGWYFVTVDASCSEEFDLRAYDHFVNGKIPVLTTDCQVRKFSRR